MDFEVTYTEEQQRFRREVRAWLETNVPADVKRTPVSARGQLSALHGSPRAGQEAGREGLALCDCPCEVRRRRPRRRPRHHPGGRGRSVRSLLPPYYDSGGRLGSASILVWGTEEQRQAFLPPIYTGEVRTWQLLTEPGAGSDLAGVRATTAVRDGDDYVINGQKIFVGSDNGADRIWMIACTDPNGARHQNLSWFMIDANLPGITVQPMELMGTGGEGGTDSGVKNTVYFDDVRVPAFSARRRRQQGLGGGKHAPRAGARGRWPDRAKPCVGPSAPLLPGDEV